MKARLRLFTMLAIASMALSLESCTKDKPSLSPQNPESQLWEVKADSVYDGDTFRVIKDNKELKIRMCGIDAPEKRQPYNDSKK